ncbi:MAG: TIGR02453 family protein, partial [Cyclobacteriaceae bacterium]
MPHFESSFTDFLKELDANNNREWFAENRRRYETQVKEVFKGFVDKLLPYVREIDPDISISTKDAVFRINRDNRFNQELLPYYTYMRVFFAKGGRRSPFAGFYLKIGHDFINIGGGALFLEKENLKKVRIEIAFNDEEFHSIISNPTFVSTFGQIKG